MGKVNWVITAIAGVELDDRNIHTITHSIEYGGLVPYLGMWDWGGRFDSFFGYYL